MEKVITILALGWLACLFVQIWTSSLWKTKYLKTLKPFSCQPCMGFWIGVLFFIKYPLPEIFIHSSMTSLAAFMLYNISNIIAKHNTGI
ncbi:MAG: hypothetical protein A2Z57_12065 [Planctomycetes bacterium RIFCSPHIGHO2_12_39_6]|nr:MAG: hypothetical protein A2Z57_12065 [Planctomycetes bacterium RIFCSPHIGHO2_12_39_6]